MIAYYEKSSHDEKLKKLRAYSDNCWIHVEEPTEAQIIKLAKNYKIDEDILLDCLDSYEIPRLEVEDKVPYMFCRTPFMDGGQLHSVPILIVLHPKFILTIAQEETNLFNKFFKDKIEFSIKDKNELLTKFLFEVNIQYSRILTGMSKKIYKAIDNINKIENKDITNLVQYEQTANEMLSRLTQLNGVLNILNNNKVVKFNEEDKDEIEDIYLANNQLIDLTKNMLQSVTNIRDSYSALLTNNLNNVMKVLTMFTVILAIPTMVAGLWGMNISNLPFANSPYGLLYILGLSFTVLIVIFAYFKKKGWF